MEYRLLGDTGLKVSVLGMGAMTFDTVEKTIELLKCVRSYGVKFRARFPYIESVIVPTALYIVSLTMQKHMVTQSVALQRSISVKLTRY